MDFLDIIITIAILGVGSLLTGSKSGKKAASRQSAHPRPAASPNPFQTIFETDEAAENVWNEDYAEDVKEEEPYFTYESPNVSEAFNSQPEHKEQVNVCENTVLRPSVMGEEFDLRKAFIYQTILTRVEC